MLEKRELYLSYSFFYCIAELLALFYMDFQSASKDVVLGKCSLLSAEQSSMQNRCTWDLVLSTGPQPCDRHSMGQVGHLQKRLPDVFIMPRLGGRVSLSITNDKIKDENPWAILPLYNFPGLKTSKRGVRNIFKEGKKKTIPLNWRRGKGNCCKTTQNRVMN